MENCGPFTLLGPLGAGSLTEVVRAVRVQDGRGGRRYALKRTLPALDGEPDFVAQFKDMGMAACLLNHPNIVRTWDAAVYTPANSGGHNRAYVAQDLASGRPLNQLLNHLLTTTREIPRPLTFTVLCGVLQGLSHAHNAQSQDGRHLGLFHGDLAPSAVMVGVDGEVRVGDFCVGRARAFLKNGPTQHLRARWHYMSPEMARTGAQDARSDLYTVGVMLHEMLAFRRLRRGSNPQEVLAQAQSGVWPALEALNVPTDAELSAVLARALQDDPAQRYQSAQDFLGALQSYAQPRNLLMSAFDLGSALAAAFPNLAAEDDAGEAEVARLFDAIQGTSAPSLPPVAATPPTPEVKRKPRPVKEPSEGGTSKTPLIAALALGGLLVAGGGGWLMLRSSGTEDETQGGPREAPRDLTRLIGGRTVNFWTARVAQLDDAIKTAKTSGTPGEVERLTAAREDTVRKGRALGIPDLGAVPAQPSKPAE